MYHPGGTIEQALDRIASREYVLPAIQREFVWSPEQICALFDSLMQGYPFGEFLFWQIDADNSGDYRYYDFVKDYHQRDNPHCPDLGVLQGKQLTAVLDGQQRLTAFNIGLRGSMATKMPRLWWSSPGAFPRRVLALDLLARLEKDDQGNRYKFDFLDENKVGLQGGHLWFRVGDILGMDPADITDWLFDMDLSKEQGRHASRTLHDLHHAVRTKPTVTYYEERNQDIEHVLSIFIRRNSGGTVLAYSDLLLSIAVSQWEKLDARKEVHALVDELNRIGAGLGLSKDFVLKAGLMLTDIASVGFEVRNFTHANMAKLEENWPEIKDALAGTVQLVTDFGFDSKTVRANSALLPIAYYFYKIGSPPNFGAHPLYEDDRNAIKGWLTRSILKASGIWGSGLDTLLTALREVLRSGDGERFPVTALYATMAQRGKSLEFHKEEVEDLADMEISDRRMFALLILLFPSVDVRTHHFHIDHVFPKSLFTEARLRAAGVGDDQIEAFTSCVNRVGNLQLLEGVVNNEKRAKLPSAWIADHFTDDKRRQHIDRHLLGDVPAEITSFLKFYDGRRERLRKRIYELVGQA